MIERHYFRDRLLKEFEFKFPFCIPGSTNTVEQVYEVPKLTEEESKLGNVEMQIVESHGVAEFLLLWEARAIANLSKHCKLTQLLAVT